MSNIVDFAVDYTKQRASHLIDEAALLRDRLQQQAEEFKDEKIRMLKEFELEKKRWIAQSIFNKLDGLFESAMSVVLIKTKEAADDPYMPRFVKGWVDAIIDSVWPDVKCEVRDAVITGIRTDVTIFHGEPTCCGNPIAFVRYTLYPYDRNIWRKIRDPVWWLLMLLYCFPRYAVSQFFFGLTFLFIDHEDEYQLEQYILSFKSIQFVSLGILSTMVGAGQYYYCTTKSPSTCPTDSAREELYTLGLFVMQIFVVWIAFLMIPHAQRKGGQYYQVQKASLSKVKADDGHVPTLGEVLLNENFTSASQQVDEQAAEASRRRLMGFLVYDFIIFLICAGLSCFVAFYNVMDTSANVTSNNGGVTDDNWKFTSALYWIKVLYGFLSFPFVILSLPLFSTLISHARPTGYNRWGRTVPYIGHEEECPVPWDPERGKKADEVKDPAKVA